MLVSEIMTKNVVTVNANERVRELLDRLAEKNIRHAPVLRSGELVGVISDRDIKSYMLPDDEAFAHPELAEARLDARAENVIQSDLVTVEDQSTISEAIDMMLDYKLGALPVISAKSGSLVGIISYVDILRAAQDVL